MVGDRHILNRNFHFEWYNTSNFDKKILIMRYIQELSIINPNFKFGVVLSIYKDIKPIWSRFYIQKWRANARLGRDRHFLLSDIIFFHGLWRVQIRANRMISLFDSSRTIFITEIRWIRWIILHERQKIHVRYSGVYCVVRGLIMVNLF